MLAEGGFQALVRPRLASLPGFATHAIAHLTKPPISDQEGSRPFSAPPGDFLEFS